MTKKFFDPTMIRFILVGVINTIVGTGTMFLAYNWMGCSYWVSSAANYVVGGIVSFFLNKFFTFKNNERSWSQVFKFILTIAGCYMVGYGLAKPFAMWVLKPQIIETICDWLNIAATPDAVTKIQENVAMCIGMCLFVVLNYFTQRFFVFKKKEQ